MPTSAVTGTKQVQTKRVGVGDDTRTKSEREADENAAAARAELATLASNGTIQVQCSDGSITNVDGGQPDWKDQVRKLDPKHPVLKYDR